MLRTVALIAALFAVAIAEEGWSYWCDSYDVGDGYCDMDCYSANNDWDGGDCDSMCNAGCADSDIGDGYCDSYCFTEGCSWDDGDCEVSYCGDFNCAEYDYGDGYCDYECATSDCAWDDGDCFYLNCAPFCDPASPEDSTCDWECNTVDCLWDGGDCLDYCSAGCPNDYLGDGACDGSCFNEDCNWDNGDCDSYDYCSYDCANSDVGDGVCDYYCMTSDCDYDGGDCDGTYCGDSCYETYVGNGVCNPGCNVEECNWDDGDCDIAVYETVLSYTDLECDSTLLSVAATGYTDDSYCSGYGSVIICSYNTGYSCWTPDDLDSYVNDNFDSDPAWMKTWYNDNCDGDAYTAAFITNDCVLMDNNLWGQMEYTSEGLVVTWTCTDDLCENCFVEPEGDGVDWMWMDGCYTDGSLSYQFSGAATLVAGVAAFVFALVALF